MSSSRRDFMKLVGLGGVAFAERLRLQGQGAEGGDPAETGSEP